MVVEELIQALYFGVSYGMILVLASVGLSLIFGLMGVVNFAHGAFYALGAFVGYSTYEQTGSFVVAFFAAGILVGVLGAVSEYVVIRPLYDREAVYQLPATFGLAIVIIEGIKAVWGTSSQPFSIPPYLSGTVTAIGIDFGLYRIFIIGVGTVLVVALWTFLMRTKNGLVIRAALFNSDMVKSMGYDVNRRYTLLFAIGTAYAAVAGMIIAPLFGTFPEMGNEIIILAFVVVILGGLGSFKGVVYSGLFIGIAISMSRVYVPQYADIVPFLIMIPFFLYRPHGFFGVEGAIE